MDKGLLKRALEDTEDPTPGYMFRDIAQWTFIDHNTQTKLIAFLMDKLNPNTSVHVLAKTLKVIKVLCETGHTDFQKEMQRVNDTIKQFASFRGKPDPKYGDKLNEKVRQFAREAVEAAFTHRKEVKLQVIQGHGCEASTTQPEARPTFTTGGSVATSSSAVVDSQLPAGSQGRVAAMPTTNKWAEHMAAAAAGKPVSSDQQGIVGSFVTSAKTGFGLWRENVKSTEELVMESLTQGTEFKPIEIGGPISGGFGGATSSGGWKFTEDAGTGASGAAQFGSKEETKILTPYQLEVEKICSYKNTPQRVDLAQFVSTIENIVSHRGEDSLEELAEALDERLQQKYSWQQRLNVMCAIEAIVRQQPPVPGRGAFEAYFNENPEDIQRNVHVVQASLKEKSLKVIKFLGLPERTTSTVEHSAAQQISMATSGGGISWSSSVPASVGAPGDVSGVTPVADDDMLGGMTVKSRGGKSSSTSEDKTKLRKRATMRAANDDDMVKEEAPKQCVAPSSDSWGQWGADPASGSNPSAGFSNDWGTQNTVSTSSWSAPSATPAPSTASPQPPAAPSQRNELDDFFGNNSAPRVPPPIPEPQRPVNPPAAQFPAAAVNPQIQMIMQMQQQLQMMMSQINMSDPSAVSQMQALMQQQQQLMAMVATLPAQTPQVAASPMATVAESNPVVVPHGHFQVSMPQSTAQQRSSNDSFAAVQQEMMSKLMSK
eukprot:CAMPEP_0176414858 /NCGR_PEP_ID=MMETSP0127-20121128/5492_1 /TAXON_ID=938130 /ORGANISM="Platyophrya macrostoma, Strain WH" /LENGTH=713 /DNA_ID=CAMNT_0017794805 /DNA_START=88 /DNA_END=2230 /DNA_ORIENTATION=+